MMGRLGAAWLAFRRRGFIYLVLGGSLVYFAGRWLVGWDPNFGFYNLLLSIDASVMGAILVDLMLRMSEQDRAQFARIEQGESRIEALEARIADALERH